MSSTESAAVTQDSWWAEASAVRSQIADRREQELIDLGPALCRALAIGRKLQQACDPARRAITEAPSPDALRAIEALLREVLAVVPRLMPLAHPEGGAPPAVEAKIVRWRSLWASDALHAGLAAAYGSRARRAKER